MGTEQINKEIEAAEKELVGAKKREDVEAIATLTEKIYQLKKKAKKETKK